MSNSRNDLVQLVRNVEGAADPAQASAVTDPPTGGLNRRSMLKALAATAALPLLVDACATPDTAPGTAAGVASGGGKVMPGKGPRGTPSDPVLINPTPKVPWPMVLTNAELATLAALCDTIIPADEKSPAASKVGAHEYINEIASEPSRSNLLVQIRGGVMWINAESTRRFGKPFHEIGEPERTAICDDICFVPKAKPEHLVGALFFDRVRDLTSGAFYTTPEGWKDIGYIGNVALPEYKGPPAEVLQRLGLV
ncbi:MAG: gluconate 2-dehydrogenase subunit 3 family protein [Phycisphaerae bacterium]|nr:gluconate 2-dehydrogenase subunit 3 family protein [Gemmatimonadaceae bacterium]